MIIDSKDKLPLSGLIIAQDEEAYIEKAIINLKPNVKEVVVIDGGSKDKTVEIALKHGCRVEKRPFDWDFSAQRNFGIECIETPWILWLDADEFFDDHAFDVIAQLMVAHIVNDEKVKNVAGYQFYRVSKFDGRRVDNDNDFQWRLTSKHNARWDGKIHEGVTFDAGFEGKKLPKEFVLNHQHSMKRQRFNNKLYHNLNNKINVRPKENEGMEYKDDEGRWVDVETERNG